jgi:hypothetical protein
MFSFKDVHNWYLEHIHDSSMFEVDRAVQCWHLYQRSDSQQFMLDRVRNIRKIRTISDRYEDLYPHGMYAVTDYRANWLLFVYPMPKSRFDGSPFPVMTADHFSLPYFPKQRKQVQLHHTYYIPMGVTGKQGSVQHEPSHFKDNTPYAGIPISPALNEYKASILELLNPAESLTMSGGAQGLKKRKSNPPQPSPKKKRAKSLENAEEICQKWATNKIEHIMIFVQKRGDTYDCTCLVYDKLRRRKNDAFKGCAFALPKVNESVLRERALQYVLELP